ncbi:MAG TPA: right-handed parallel beta-helix repeat-containing protein, partial [Chitinophagaceae bacterium]
MIKKTVTLLTCLLVAFVLHAQEVALKNGLVIRKNTKVKKGTYLLKAKDNLSTGVIIIEGNNITIDFNNAILKGSDLVQKPDAFKGLAVYIRKGKNITIKNLNAIGYKVALLARNIEGLTIENCNFSYNYRQHLNSSQVKEDISDWMSYHHNEKDEWLRYGAAIYLRNCDKATISNNTVTGGQNALMITESDGGLIYNNNFSFNSGIGIGMYRSGNNKVLYNILRFNVRGYSHGVYNRGQDSAGILV